MKNFPRLALVLTALLGSPAAADYKDEDCKMDGMLSEAIMTARQAEVPLSTTLQTADGFGGTTKERIRKMIFVAYDEPSYLSESAQRRAVMEFRNKMERECYRR